MRGLISNFIEPFLVVKCEDTLFLPKFPVATFIQEAIFIPDTRVGI